MASPNTADSEVDLEVKKKTRRSRGNKLPCLKIMTDLKCKMYKTLPTAKTPTKLIPTSVGFDLYAAKNVYIQSGYRAVIPTGIAIKAPPNHYGQIYSRSGLAAKHGIYTLGGVIDPDYAESIQVILINNGMYGYDIKLHDRIAQLVFHIHNPKIELVKCDNRARWQSVRGKNGFGSTGR